MNWSRISRRLRRLFCPAVFCPKYSGHCTRALTFPRWDKRRDQWRAVISCAELLALFFAADTAGSWQTTSSLGVTATLGFEEGCTIPSYDGANALRSIYRHRFMPALAEIVPSVVPYASNLYAREPPNVLFALDVGGLEVVESARGVQQGCNLGPLCYSAGLLKSLK